MKYTFFLFTLFNFFFFVTFTPSSLHAQTDELTFAFNAYPGLAGCFLMDKKLEKDQPTFLERRMKETGGKVKIIITKDYIPTVQAYAAGKYDSVSVSIADSIPTCSDAEVATRFYILTGYSNGGDGIIVPKGWKLSQMKGKTIIGDKLSCMEILFQRWLELNGKPRDYMVFKNTLGEEAPKIFLSNLDQSTELACLTWEPMMMHLIESGKAEIAFSTANTPGELVNGFSIREDRIKGREKSIEALVKAYYDAVDYYMDPKTHDKALRAVASDLGFSQEDLPLLKKIMDSQVIFTKEESLRFMKSGQFQRSKEIAIDFFKQSGALKIKNPDTLDVKIDTRFLE